MHVKYSNGQNQSGSYIVCVRVTSEHFFGHLPGGAVGAGLWEMGCSSRREAKMGLSWDSAGGSSHAWLALPLSAAQGLVLTKEEEFLHPRGLCRHALKVGGCAETRGTYVRIICILGADSFLQNDSGE